MKPKSNKIELISCGKCGNTFAAIVDGDQDKEWNDQKAKYVEFGCAVEVVGDEWNRGLTNCSCPKTKQQAKEIAKKELEEKEQAALKNQLNLF